LKHALTLGLGLALGLGTVAFTDSLNPVSPFIPSSLVLDAGERLPETMRWVDPQFGFATRHATGVLEVRWYCAYPGMNGLEPGEAQGKFAPLAEIDRPEPPAEGAGPDFYYELTRTQTDPCPVFRFGNQYPAK